MQEQLEHQKKESSDTIPFYYNTWFCLGLIVCLLTAGYLWDNFMSQKVVVTKVETASAQRQRSQNSSGIKYAKIQDIEVGERAIGKNPEVTDEDRQLFFPDPEPSTWRKLTLEMIKPDGKRLDVTLLRPLTWIEESQAEVNATISLDLPEMGAQGNAKVLAIAPCPPIKPGKGNVITGTFHHEAANTIDLYVEGLSKPIGTTDNHPFWSATRQEFVEAGKLQPDEDLQLYNGQTAKVVQIKPRPGPERVHNLEVLNEHVYWVTNTGVLVHNSCLDVPIINKLSNSEKASYRQKARNIWDARFPTNVSRTDKQIHHRFPLEYSHLMPKADPNRISNLILLDISIHQKINTEWTEFRNAYPNPTASDVLKFCIEIDKKYGSSMTFSN